MPMKRATTLHAAKRLLLIMTVIMTVAHAAFAQVPITGTVKDETGAGMPGVNIIVVNTNIGTTTDADGKYSLAVSSGSISLSFSFIGYTTVTVPVDNRSVVDVTMEQDIASLEEVVVTALGVKREKRQLTYSTQEVSGDELVRSKEPNIINGLAGKVSGVQITSSSGTPGASTRIVIRGATSVYG